jgi:prepilin-type N-terminal cleavage/methylation domain-containing protein
MMIRSAKQSGTIRKSVAGFSLIELMVSMAIFLVISGAALRLFSLQQNSASIERDQVGLNLALRNAVTQLQIDIANAGSNYLQNVNIPNWPLGVSIVNNVVTTGNSCYNSTTQTYGWQCFDQVNVITAADPTKFPALTVTDSSGGSSPSLNCINTSGGYAYSPPATSLTAAQTAALFKSGDQMLLLKADASKLTTVVLTANASTLATASNGTIVKFQFNDTNGNGTNSLANDPLNISTCNSDGTCGTNPPADIGNQFCANDYIILVVPISYVVCAGPGSPSPCDTTSTSPDIADPKLERVQTSFDSSNNPSKTASIVMEQVIGFKVGASIENTSNFQSLGIDTSSSQYIYDASTYTNASANDLRYDFTAVRSVRASIIARTTPNTLGTYTFRNSFDQGPYQVQGMAVAVNARNMSMND